MVRQVTLNAFDIASTDEEMFLVALTSREMLRTMVTLQKRMETLKQRINRRRADDADVSLKAERNELAEVQRAHNKMHELRKHMPYAARGRGERSTTEEHGNGKA